MSKQVNIGVIGVGHLGVHHASHLTKIKNANFVGLFDSNTQRAEEISKKLNTKSFDSIDSLLPDSYREPDANNNLLTEDSETNYFIEEEEEEEEYDIDSVNMTSDEAVIKPNQIVVN